MLKITHITSHYRDTLSCQNYFFQRVWDGGYIKFAEILERWKGIFLCSKYGHSEELGVLVSNSFHGGGGGGGGFDLIIIIKL